MRRPTSEYTISTKHGSPIPGSRFGKHLGTDYAGSEGRDVASPVGGVVTMSYYSGSIGNTIELKEDGNGRLHRFAHNKTRLVSVGQRVSEGQKIAVSGNTGSFTTGPHLHWDVRKANTNWGDSFGNYYDPEALLAQANKPKPKMPPVGSKIQLLPKDVRTTFRPGTTTVAGRIDVKDNTYFYFVRGYDPKYPYRITINSASAGGNGVSLALYYTNGKLIPGWK